MGEILEEKKPKELVEDSYLGNIDATYKCDSSAVKNINSDEMNLKFYYTLDDYLRELDTMLVIQPVQFGFTGNPFENEKRYFPIDFDYPIKYYSVCEISLAENLRPVSIPEPIALEIPGIRFTKNCMFDGVKVIINCQLAITQPAYPPLVYPDIRKLFIDMAAASTEEIVLVSASD